MASVALCWVYVYAMRWLRCGKYFSLGDIIYIFICIIRVQPRHLWPQTHIFFFTSSMNSTFGCQVILASKSLASSEPALVFSGNILQLREHLLKEGNLKRWEDEKFSKGVRGARGARIGLVPLCFFFGGGRGGSLGGRKVASQTYPAWWQGLTRWGAESWGMPSCHIWYGIICTVIR